MIAINNDNNLYDNNDQVINKDNNVRNKIVIDTVKKMCPSKFPFSVMRRLYHTCSLSPSEILISIKLQSNRQPPCKFPEDFNW